MASVKWLPEAIADFERLYIFLEGKDTDAAARAASAILDGTAVLKTSPRIGKPMPDDTGRRELIVSFGAGAYILRYMLQDEKTVIIIRVWHSRENR